MVFVVLDIVPKLFKWNFASGQIVILKLLANNFKVNDVNIIYKTPVIDFL